jgi:hypothetical protein
VENLQVFFLPFLICASIFLVGGIGKRCAARNGHRWSHGLSALLVSASLGIIHHLLAETASVATIVVTSLGMGFTGLAAFVYFYWLAKKSI